jgi:hypothetical protein
MSLNEFATSPLRLDRTLMSRLLEGQLSIGMSDDVLVANILVHVLQYGSLLQNQRWRCTAINSDTKFALIHRTTGAVGFWVWDDDEARFTRLNDSWDAISLLSYALRYMSIPDVQLVHDKQDPRKVIGLVGPAAGPWNRDFFKPRAYTGILLARKEVIDEVERWQGPGRLLTVDVNKYLP